MPANYDIPLRELDQRTVDGIEVRLLWDDQTDRIFVAVEDRRYGGRETFEVGGAEALAAFHHPYAYADWPRRSASHTHQPETRRR